MYTHMATFLSLLCPSPTSRNIVPEKKSKTKSATKLPKTRSCGGADKTKLKLSIRIQVAAARGAVDREFDYIESLNLAVRPPPSAQHAAPIIATAKK